MASELNKYNKIQLCFKTIYPVAIAFKFVYSNSFYRMRQQLPSNAVISNVPTAPSTPRIR